MRSTPRPAWLDPLQATLDTAPEQVTFFFRDDDVGWRDDRLGHLLDLFARLRLPLDLAVIPAALEREGAIELRERLEQAEGRLGVHQHGYAHLNHEPEGRKCEFGPARDRGQQLGDIEAGRARLDQLLGRAVEPIFTPPWNRCSVTTGRCLVELGFEVLSREARAAPLGIPKLRELPVQVDWSKRRDGVRLPPGAIAELAAAAAERGGPVGTMLHHAVMEESDLRAAGELLTLLARHDRARCLRMRDSLREAAAPALSRPRPRARRATGSRRRLQPPPRT